MIAYISKREYAFVISRGFNFHETSQSRSFAKMKPSRKFSNLQYPDVELWSELIYIHFVVCEQRQRWQQCTYAQIHPHLCFWQKCILHVISLRARLFIDGLWLPAGKGLTSWLSFVMSNCEFVTFPLVSWVRCGTWLYRFLIFARFLTFMTKCVNQNFNMWSLRIQNSDNILILQLCVGKSTRIK